MTPLQTEHAGITFRSRLEARWAIVFDELEVEWRYEPEGFDLEHGRYLPDFWIPDIGWWEVKGASPTEHECNLAHDLAEATDERTFIAWGDIPRDVDDHGYGLGDEPGWGPDARRGLLVLGGGVDFDYSLCICPRCGRVGCEYEGRSERICRHGDDPLERGHNGDHPRLVAAYAAARGARMDAGRFR